MKSPEESLCHSLSRNSRNSGADRILDKTIWQCEHQNSWDLWMFIPLKIVLIGIDLYPYVFERDLT